MIVKKVVYLDSDNKQHETELEAAKQSVVLAADHFGRWMKIGVLIEPDEVRKMFDAVDNATTDLLAVIERSKTE